MGRVFTEEEITQGLTVLAACAGQVTLAERTLEEMGTPIHHETLERWRDVAHPEKYARIRDEVQAHVEPAIIAETKETIVRAQRGISMALEHVIFRLERKVENRPAEVAVALQKVFNGQVDRLQLLTGRPTSITESRSPDEVIRALEAQGISIGLDPSEVEELSEVKALNGGRG